MHNDELISLLHQLVDNLKPILGRLDHAKTVPVLKVTLNETEGRSLVLIAGIEFERPASSKTVPVTVATDSSNFNFGRVLE
jgi:hypothetical protein